MSINIKDREAAAERLFQSLKTTKSPIDGLNFIEFAFLMGTLTHPVATTEGGKVDHLSSLLVRLKDSGISITMEDFIDDDGDNALRVGVKFIAPKQEEQTEK